jgi:membrane protein
MPTDDRPEPDDTVKAAWPIHIAPQTWKYIARRTLHECVEDDVVDAAGALTFFGVLSVFPAALAIVSLIGVVGDGEEVVNRLLALLDEVAPGAVADVLSEPLADLATASTANLTLILSVLAAVWTASIYVGAFSRALNRVYEVEEGRPFWRRKPAQLAVTVLIIVLVLVVTAIVTLSGPVARAVGGALDIGDAALNAWDFGKWPVLAFAVVVMIAVLYRTTPNVHQPRFPWLSLGALLAILLLGAASAGFAFYVANFARYNQIFGTFTSVIIFLIWVFLANLALLLGAEFNAELERGRQLQAGIRAERRLQLPARQTTASDAARRTRDVDEEHGVLLRNGARLPARTDTVLPRVGQGLASLWRSLTHRRGERRSPDSK